MTSTDSSVSTSDGRAILRCRACKATGRRAFVMRYTTTAYLGRMHTRQELLLDGRPATVHDRYDVRRRLHAPCPECGSQDVRVNVVKGVRSDVECGDRCRNAKGGDCECSCGGDNHGADHRSW